MYDSLFFDREFRRLLAVWTSSVGIACRGNCMMVLIERAALEEAASTLIAVANPPHHQLFRQIFLQELQQDAASSHCIAHFWIAAIHLELDKALRLVGADMQKRQEVHEAAKSVIETIFTGKPEQALAVSVHERVLRFLKPHSWFVPQWVSGIYSLSELFFL